jgi:hypothetical protein
MEVIHGFDFFRLSFDAKGKLQNAQALADLGKRIDDATATDIIFLAHGFRNDEDDATGLYTRFLQTFHKNLGRPEFQASLGPRSFVVSGVYWPSKAFRETFKEGEGAVQGVGDEQAEKLAAEAQLQELKEADLSPEQAANIDHAMQLLDSVAGSRQAQDRFVEDVLSVLDGAEEDDATEGLEQIRSKEGADLLDALRTPVVVPTGRGADDEGGIASVNVISVPGEDAGEAQGIQSLFGSVFGRIGQFLNLITWYQMKNRSGVVGSTGIAKAVRDLKAGRTELKVHLVGHSLGGRLMAACAKALATPKLQPDSLTLLQAAFSHYGFSPDNGEHTPGFFRAVIAEQVVRGPLIATFSEQDSVVGKVYAVASRLAGDNVKAVGDPNDPFGGIGRNGAQKTEESVEDVLHAIGEPYGSFPTQRVVNLNGSGGLITSHGDVTNESVTYAFAAAVAQT